MLIDNKAGQVKELVWYVAQRGGLFPRQHGERIVSGIECQVRWDTTATWTDAGALNLSQPLFWFSLFMGRSDWKLRVGLGAIGMSSAERSTVEESKARQWWESDFFLFEIETHSLLVLMPSHNLQAQQGFIKKILL